MDRMKCLDVYTLKIGERKFISTQVQKLDMTTPTIKPIMHQFAKVFYDFDSNLLKMNKYIEILLQNIFYVLINIVFII